jgi:conjugal transfer pilus assembly protein TraW
MLFLFGSASGAMAISLGAHGKTYPILEQDLVQVIGHKLKKMDETGALAKLETSFKNKIKDSIERPIPVKGIQKTEKERIFLFDPSINVGKDIFDHEGHLIQKKGSNLNPLDHVQLRKPLLIFDGDDQSQIEWAIAQERMLGEVTFILIKGPILALRKKLQRDLFFDQHGTISSRFQIKQTPARIQQKGKQFLVEELKVAE